MTGRSIWVGLILATLTPTIALSQGLEIDHKAVGCIVVGKYPKMNACFSPASSLARSRVYFRPEGTPSWYYVEMKSDQPCLTGILPKPGKKLVGKHVEYYLEAQNKAFNPSRTAEYAPIVVKSAQECKKDIPIAPFVNNATVAVFPSVPAGFVGGGIGAAATVGIIGAGAAAATTAVVVASNNDDNTTTTIASSVSPTTTAPTVTTTLVTTTTTTLPKANKAPNAVLRTKPDPPQGDGPLNVIFDMCGSSDPDGDPLTYFFEFGDGSKTSGPSCVESHTYSASFREAAAGKGDVKAQDSTYNFEGSAVDPSGASATRSRTVVATKPAPACGNPSVSIVAPSSGGCQTSGTVGVTVNAADASGISNVTVKGSYTGNSTTGGPCVAVTAVQEDSKTATGGPPTFNATLNLIPAGSVPPFGTVKCYNIGATATNSCGNTANTSINYILAHMCTSPPTYPYPVFHDLRRGMAWESELQVEGGRLQLVVNGSAVSYPETGRGYGMAAFVDGPNRVEATVVEARGKAGIWRFKFIGSEAIASGSLRVVAGEAVEITDNAVSFRLSGRAGERISFMFDKK